MSDKSLKTAIEKLKKIKTLFKDHPTYSSIWKNYSEHGEWMKLFTQLLNNVEFHIIAMDNEAKSLNKEISDNKNKKEELRKLLDLEKAEYDKLIAENNLLEKNIEEVREELKTFEEYIKLCQKTEILFQKYDELKLKHAMDYKAGKYFIKKNKKLQDIVYDIENKLNVVKSFEEEEREIIKISIENIDKENIENIEKSRN